MLLGGKPASTLFKESFQRTHLGELCRGAGAGATGEPSQLPNGLVVHQWYT
jgi:hypothetical protein